MIDFINRFTQQFCRHKYTESTEKLSRASFRLKPSFQPEATTCSPTHGVLSYGLELLFLYH